MYKHFHWCYGFHESKFILLTSECLQTVFCFYAIIIYGGKAVHASVANPLSSNLPGLHYHEYIIEWL